MRPLTGKALARAFFGPRRRGMGKGLLVPVLLFAAVRGAQITLPGPVEAAALCTAFSAGAMVQTLGDRRHLEELEELFLLPMPDRWFALCYGTVLAAHTLLTKTLPLWALLAALCPGRPGELAAALVWSAAACWGCAAGYGLFRRGRWVPVLLWGAGAAAVVLLGSLPVQLAGAAVSAGVAGVCLCRLGPWEFQRLAPARGPRRRRSGGVLGYLFRALSADRRSWLNTAGLWAGACLLPLALAPASGRELLPVPLALCGLNTPAATLFSRDPALAQALVVLPGGGRRFWRGYVGFLAALYGAALVLCLGAWQLAWGAVGPGDLAAVPLLTLEGALLAAALERWRPLRRWKTESDLWHHPRKYLVPLALLPLALAGVGRPVVLCLWAGALALQVALFFRTGEGRD